MPGVCSWSSIREPRRLVQVLAGDPGSGPSAATGSETLAYRSPEQADTQALAAALKHANGTAPSAPDDGIVAPAQRVQVHVRRRRHGDGAGGVAGDLAAARPSGAGRRKPCRRPGRSTPRRDGPAASRRPDASRARLHPAPIHHAGECVRRDCAGRYCARRDSAGRRPQRPLTGAPAAGQDLAPLLVGRHRRSDCSPRQRSSGATAEWQRLATHKPSQNSLGRIANRTWFGRITGRQDRSGGLRTGGFTDHRGGDRVLPTRSAPKVWRLLDRGVLMPFAPGRHRRVDDRRGRR